MVASAYATNERIKGRGQQEKGKDDRTITSEDRNGDEGTQQSMGKDEEAQNEASVEGWDDVATVEQKRIENKGGDGEQREKKAEKKEQKKLIVSNRPAALGGIIIAPWRQASWSSRAMRASLTAA